MAFVQVSASVQTTGASSLSPSLTGVVAGNSLVYGISMWHASAPASTPPTNYLEQVESAAAVNTKVACGYRLSAPSGTNTPSIGLAASSWGRAFLLEYGTLATPESSSSGASNGTTASSGNITPSGTTSMLIGVVTSAPSSPTITPNASWTQRAESEDNDAGQAINIMERTNTTGAQAATWTVPDNFWAACAVSYPAGAAAPTLPPGTIQSRWHAAHRAASI